MDNMNKIISFVLGLVVVAIFLVIISGRLQIGKRFLSASRGAGTTGTPAQSAESITVTEKVSTTVTPTEKAAAKGNVANKKTSDNASNIPNTGPETTFMLLLVVAGFSGYGLWKLSEV